jgi:hypothetical protein
VQDAFPANGTAEVSTSPAFPGASLRRILTGVAAGEDRFASSGDSGSAISEKTHKARGVMALFLVNLVESSDCHQAE